jgi:LmbE family N-acetylglucosaminyl deacetylase
VSFYRRLIDSVRSGAPTLPPIPALPPSAATAPSGPKTVVMYTAHPDDESGYAGGTLKKLSDGGHHVTAVSLTHGEGGRVVKRRGSRVVELQAGVDFPVDQLVRRRDAEMTDAAGRMRIHSDHLFDAKLGLDFGYTTSTSEVLTRWDQDAPGGLEGIVQAIVADIRKRKPDVVMALMEVDPREHGAHKASAILVDIAARLAADPQYGDGEPHVVREFVTVGSEHAPDDLLVPVDKNAWHHTMAAYRTQFIGRMVSQVDQAIRGDDTSHEEYKIRWQASGAITADGRSLFESMVT